MYKNIIFEIFRLLPVEKISTSFSYSLWLTVEGIHMTFIPSKLDSGNILP